MFGSDTRSRISRSIGSRCRPGGALGLASRPDGSRAELIRWNSRADWGRRYWFDKPIALPRGSRIEVVANLDNPDILSEAFAMTDSKPPVAPPPLRLAINVIPAKPKPTAP